MIIAFYPGAGGNRYLQMMQGHEWTQLQVSYDNTNPRQKDNRYLLDATLSPDTGHKLTHCMNYDIITKSLNDSEIVFINSDLQQSLRREWILHGHKLFMQKQFDRSVSKLKHYQAFRDPSWPEVFSEDQLQHLPQHIQQETQADYEKNANQTGAVPGVLASLTQQLIDQVNSAYEIISWHRDYYKQWPVNFSNFARVINVDSDTDEFSVFMRQELSLYPSEIFDSVWERIHNE